MVRYRNKVDFRINKGKNMAEQGFPSNKSRFVDVFLQLDHVLFFSSAVIF